MTSFTLSNGFGVDDKEDEMVEEGNHVMRKLVCGTSKEKQKAKNIKTAGMFSSLVKFEVSYENI